MASRVASQPSGVLSTSRARISSVSRIRHGAPGVSCSPAMNPSFSQRCTVEGTRPSSLAVSATCEQFSFLGVAAGPAAGNVVAEPQCLDSSGGVGQSFGGAPVLPVEDAGDLGVGVVDGQPADQVDGVLVCADLGGLAPDRHGQLADRAAFPPQQQVRPALGVVAVDVDGDFLQQGAQQLLAVLVGGGRRCPIPVPGCRPGTRWRRVRRRSGSWAGPAHGGQVRHQRRLAVPARSPIRFPGRGRPAGCSGSTDR